MSSAEKKEKKEKKESIFKDKNSVPSLTLSLVGGHFGGIVIAIIVCMGLSSLMLNTWGRLLTQLILIFVYAFPCYSIMWAAGNRDLNRVHFGHAEKDLYRGFKLGLYGVIPVAIVSLLFLISAFGWMPNFVIPYRIINAHVWPILNITQMSYLVETFTWYQVAIFVIVPIILPLCISGISYIMGYKDFSPMQKLVYKTKGKNKKITGPAGSSAADKAANKAADKKSRYPYQH